MEAKRGRLAAAGTVLGWLTVVVLAVAGVWLAALGPRSGPLAQPPVAVQVLLSTGFATFASLGLLIAVRARGHRVGWLLLSVGGLFLAGSVAETLAKHLARRGEAHPAVAGLSWLDSWAWTVALALVVVTLLVFPTGQVPGRRWRPLLGVAVAAAGFSVLAAALRPGRLPGGAHSTNPLGWPGAAPALGLVGRVGGVLQVVAVLGALLALVVRYRGAEAEVRQQLRWLGLAGAAVVGSLPLVAVGAATHVPLAVVPFFAAVVGVPAAMAVAVLRFRLYDIDIVVNRAMVFLLLTGLVVAVYVVVVVAAGAAVGGTSRLPLAVLAASVVSVLIAPARTVVQRAADRVVFGRRATPYQVLTEFADRIGGDWGAEELLARMTQMVADATGAEVSAVYLRIDAALAVAATHPPSSDVPPTVELSGDSAFDLVQVVRDRTSVLGALALRKPPGSRLAPADLRVVRYLASHAGLMLGHARLAAELGRNVQRLAEQGEQLRRSRERLVRAQDRERRRLERDLHDGAQQDLVSIMAKARLTRNQLERGDLVTAAATVTELQEDAHRALEEVRELAQGIFPAVLQDRGLVAAVRTRAARLPLPVEVRAVEAVADLPPEIETAAYFVVTEAFANILKHSSASAVTVDLGVSERSLWLVVRDDGSGLVASQPGSGLVGLNDRVAALGGVLTVASAEPRGTELRMTVPLGVPS